MQLVETWTALTRSFYDLDINGRGDVGQKLEPLSTMLA